MEDEPNAIRILAETLEAGTDRFRDIEDSLAGTIEVLNLHSELFTDPEASIQAAESAYVVRGLIAMARERMNALAAQVSSLEYVRPIP